MKNEKGLGDKVEGLIKKVLPEIAERKKDCVSCNKKRVWLNNFGANIWPNKK